MAIIDLLSLAVLTRNERNAGTSPDSFIQVIVNIDGIDVVAHECVFLPPFDMKRANAGILPVASTTAHPIQFDSNSLTNSSVRVGIRGNDAWAPEHILLLGRRTNPSQIIPLAVEVDQEHWLSADFDEGLLTMPLRLVGLGNLSTVIRRVLLLIRTAQGGDDGTDDPIELQITAGGSIVLQQQINDTAQTDLEQSSHNWYFLDVAVPFTKNDVLSNGGIRLRILGTDAWLPRELYVYGFDTAQGRPTEIVHLFSILNWDLGRLSTDTSEGQPSVSLPVT